jgi:hypothetical protein
MDEKALKNLQVEDIFEATHKAKEKTMKMLEDESTSDIVPYLLPEELVERLRQKKSS